MMSKVKTVVDAINCHRGKAPIQRGLIFVSTFDNGVLIDKSSCTKLQFNQLVEDMSHHEGGSLFDLYTKSDKTPLTKENKVDYTSEEFWKDAPEGSEMVQAGCTVFYTTYIKDLLPEKYTVWITNKNIWRTVSGRPNECRPLIPRPKPQPVFTQAMADAGELPPIDSEYIDEDGQLCRALFHYASFVVGEMLEHLPIQQYPVFSTSRNDRILVIDTRTDKEKAIDDIKLSCGFNKINTMESTLLSKAYDSWVGDKPVPEVK